MYQMLEKITSGKGEPKDIDALEDLCYHLKDSSLCALGQTAPNPVLSTLKYFREEYEEHVTSKRCSAGVCRELMTYTIAEGKCIGCTACKKVCPSGAITGELKKPHFIVQNDCIRCGACVTRCKLSAVIRS